jgi:hypothetical protein
MAAVVLVVMQAALDAGSAAATRLCKTPGVLTICAEEDRIPKNTAVKLVQLGKSKFEVGIATIECGASTLEGETTTAGAGGAEPVKVTFKNRSFTECKDAKNNNCEAKVLRNQWNGGFYGTGNIDGSLLFENEFEFICGKESCIDEAFVINEGIVKGGEPAKIEIKLEELTLVAGAKNCSKLSLWTAIYEVASPSALYVTEN